MCILKGIDVEIFHEKLNNPDYPSNEEVEQIRKWAGIKEIEIVKEPCPCKKSHVIFLHDKSLKNDFWQKVWLLRKYIKELGFE